MDDYQQRVAAIHRALGIPADYAARTGLALQREPDPASLVEVAPGRTERRHWLEPRAAARWAALEAAAEHDGVRLVVVSAWRSLEYQQQLIERKLARGRAIEEILAVNAAPGYSEHHTGRAVDLGIPGAPPLTQAFALTRAFAWLRANAHRWGFRMSYPRDNPHGIEYEPWHWALEPDDA